MATTVPIIVKVEPEIKEQALANAAMRTPTGKKVNFSRYLKTLMMRDDPKADPWEIPLY